MAEILGIHHVTAICGDAQQNIDFYTGVLGLRLVKLTVNFDDPTAYHLYYGDALGSPGSILTFFPYPGGQSAQLGKGQVARFAFAIPPGSTPYWKARLSDSEPLTNPFGEKGLAFADPDGLSLELIETETRGAPWLKSSVQPESAIQGIRGATLCEESLAPTAQLLAETMGFQKVEEQAALVRYRIGDSTIDVASPAGVSHGRGGIGGIHHIAFRTPNDAQQEQWRVDLGKAGRHVSPVMDRQYFHSIYYREPGGALFEIATDPPGFAIDEPAESLGEALKLPQVYEPMRAKIEPLLTPLRLPNRD